MMDFLDAPVPYIVGVQNKTSDVLNGLSNAVVIDVNRNQVPEQSLYLLIAAFALLSSIIWATVDKFLVIRNCYEK